MPENPEILSLLERYLDDQLTQTEYEELSRWLKQFSSDDAWTEQLQELGIAQPPDLGYDRGRWQPVVETILRENGAVMSKNRRGLPGIGRLTAAAAVLLVLLGTSYFYLRGVQKRPSPKAMQARADVAPGGNRATLTLAGGQQIVLDTMHTGTLAQQGNMRIVKTGSGGLAYSPTKEGLNAILYNTLATPRGGQYELTLPDGTRVWLNAASSITYPTVFTGGQRKVSMTGEAYFEVAENKAQPFTVSINDQTMVEVLGTHFDINAYPDEPELETSLLEGAIKLHFISQCVVLKPGDQASINQAWPTKDSVEKIKRYSSADMEKVMAWKNGTFFFTNAKLPTVMRQLERWYNVTVTYDGSVPAGEFNGEIGRGLTLDQVLKGLASTRVHYSIEPGNKLVIRP